MRVLAISRAPWRNDNSIGNTFTALFQDLYSIEFFSLCMREQPPRNDVAKRHFFISEKQMLMRRLGKSNIVGAENSPESMDTTTEKALYDAVKKHHNTLLFVTRELLWCVGGWKNEYLRQYIKEINPDIVFFPVFGCYYPHKVLQYIHSLCDAKIILFHADDNYSLKQFSLSPLYWMYRFGLRKWVKRSVRIADLQYCISAVQKVDYEAAFACECKILTKFADFSGEPPLKSTYREPLQLVFAGNINVGRWKSLAMLVNVLERINKNGEKLQLRIYTATPITRKIKSALNRGNTSFLMGSVPASEIPRIQQDADILVHTEAMDLKNRLTVRQSFSTKIVDYLKAARPILAVGPKDVASIDHLIRNDCAIVADNKVELERKLRSILEDSGELDRVVKNAYACGRRYHNKQDIQEMLLQDLKNVCGE